MDTLVFLAELAFNSEVAYLERPLQTVQRLQLAASIMRQIRPYPSVPVM
jgi:hypothetical protein